MTGVGLWWRRLRADVAAIAILVLLLAGTSFLCVAGPRWLNRVDDQAVRYELRTSRELDDVVASYRTVLPPGPAAVDQLLAARTDVRASLEAPLAGLLDPTVVAASTELAPLLGSNGEVRAAGLPTIDVALTVLVGQEPAVRYVEGTAPAATSDAGGPFPLLRSAAGAEVETARVVEVALAVEPAAAVDVAVGDVLTIGGAYPLLVEVTGIFEPVDSTAYVWARQSGLLTDAPVYAVNGIEGNTITALVTADSLDSLTAAVDGTTALVDGPAELQVELASPVQVDRVHAGLVSDLLRSADRAESKPIESGASAIRISTSLQAPLEGYLAQRSTALAVVSIGVAGLLVIALTVLLLAARLLSERRRISVALARARGASLRQLVAVAALEAGALALVGAGIGASVAVLAVDARASRTSWWLLGLLVGVTVVTLAAVVAGQHRAVTTTERQNLTRASLAPLRLAGEAAIVVLAAVGILLFRRRGLDSAAIAQAADPYLVTVPVLVALGTAIVVIRLFPVPLRALGRLGVGSRGIVRFLGLARAGRDTGGTEAPVIVLLVGLSFAIFASVVLNSVRVEQEDVSWQEVGAHMRVDGSDFDPTVVIPNIAAAAGVSVADVFGVHVQETATVRGAGAAAAEFDLLLLDPVAYGRFVAEYPLDTSGIDALVDAPPGAGTRVPAVVSPGLKDKVLDDQLGEVPFYLPGTETVLAVVGVAPRFHEYDAGELWAIARTSDADLVLDLPYWPSILFLDAPRADSASVLAAVRERQPFAQVVDRRAVYDEVAAAPLVRATWTTYGLIVAISTGYALLAIALTLVLAAGPRSRLLSNLRTLGLSDGQARLLVGWEIVPTATIASLVGVGLGLLLPRVIMPAIDLRPFTGGLQAPPQVVDGMTVALLAVGLLAVVGAGVMVTTMVNRQRHLGAVLRVGEPQ